MHDIYYKYKMYIKKFKLYIQKISMGYTFEFYMYIL